MWVFKGWNMYVEALAGQVLIGEPWSLEICGKRNQHHIFLDNGHFASEKVLVFKFQFHLGRLVLCVCVCVCVLWGEIGQDFGSRYSWRSKFSPLLMLWLHDLRF